MSSATSIRQHEEAARAAWGDRGGACPVNVGETERTVSKFGGGALIALGLARGGLKGLVLAGIGGALVYRGTTGRCSLYQKLGVDTAGGEQGAFGSVESQGGVRVDESVVIDKSAEELYFFWRDHSNLPRFMSEIRSVTSPDGVVSHWVSEGPLGLTLEWDAEIYNDEPGRLIAWRSLPGSQMATAGSVHFNPRPSGRGTEVRVNQKFDPPGGSLGVGVAKLIGYDPASVTRENLRRFKQLMEAGELPTTSGQPSGRA